MKFGILNDINNGAESQEENDGKKSSNKSSFNDAQGFE
jgi:hypothetical protein